MSIKNCRIEFPRCGLEVTEAWHSNSNYLADEFWDGQGAWKFESGQTTDRQ